MSHGLKEIANIEEPDTKRARVTSEDNEEISTYTEMYDAVDEDKYVLHIAKDRIDSFHRKRPFSEEPLTKQIKTVYKEYKQLDIPDDLVEYIINSLEIRLS